MELARLFEKARTHFNSNRPFVLYRKPHADTVQAYFQKSDKRYELTTAQNEGFVFANFSGDSKLLIPKDQSEYFVADVEPTDTRSELNNLDDRQLSIEKERHIDLVTKGVVYIESGVCDKVVLSRCEQLELRSFSLESSFSYLLADYKNALCYAWFHPDTGVWLGATPEILLSIHNHQLTTMSLAGTQLFSGALNVQWGQKERQEQAYVTDYIAGILQETLGHVNRSEPYSIRAGSLLHLRSDLTATFDEGAELDEVLERLHPTPAVCGLPKEPALDFIQAHEGYDREFYTGFLGELNGASRCDLYVNLRCVKIEGTKGFVYVGGGITADSDSESEWQETVAKSTVIKKALAFG